MTPKQASLFPKLCKGGTEYGGGKEKGKRKTARPFSPKLSMHLVLRAEKAKGMYSFLKPRHRHLIETLLKKYANIYHIKVYRFQNVGNHLHLLIQTEAKQYTIARANLTAFLRRFCGQVAMEISGGRKASAFGRFWDEIVYSRLVSWGREFSALTHYFIKNLFQAHGIWNRKKFPDWELICIQAAPG